ncbi:MAG: hypothetical protein ACR5KV_06825 [Wolbachia sp.]
MTTFLVSKGIEANDQDCNDNTRLHEASSIMAILKSSQTFIGSQGKR